MADEEKDKSQQTEEPTEHRLEQAREKGQIPLSKEVGHALVILSCTLFIAMLAPYSFKKLSLALRPYLAFHHLQFAEGDDLQQTIFGTLWEAFGAIALPILFIMIGALIAGLGQTKFLISFEPLLPKFEKLSFGKGIKRLFSIKNLTTFLQTLLKISFVGTILYLFLNDIFKQLEGFLRLETTTFLIVLQDKIVSLFIMVLIGVAVIAFIDIFYQRFSHRQDLKMSKKDVKDEQKDIDGNPEVKQKLRQIRQERANKRMIEKIPEASVVITNPTHYAVALKYEHGVMGAPIVLAKGGDFMAQRIKEMAAEKDIPILQNPPLARALYANIEAGDVIPENYYVAVAKIIRYIMGVDQNYLPDEEDLDAV